MKINLYKVVTKYRDCETTDYVAAEDMCKVEKFYDEFEKPFTISKIATNEDYFIEKDSVNFVDLTERVEFDVKELLWTLENCKKNIEYIRSKFTDQTSEATRTYWEGRLDSFNQIISKIIHRFHQQPQDQTH